MSPVRHLLTDLVEALDGSYLDALARPDLTRFYPRLRAYQETGAKRGCIVPPRTTSGHLFVVIEFASDSPASRTRPPFGVGRGGLPHPLPPQRVG